MTKWLAEIHFDACMERLEWQIRHLRSREREWSKAKQAQRRVQDPQSRAERAFTFIYTAGALEDLFRCLDTDIPTDLRRLNVKRRDLRPAALAMLVPEVWDSISGDRVTKMVKRSSLVQAANDFYVNNGPIDFEALKNLGVSDGRTVNPHHFEALWDGLCLSADTDSIWITRAHRQAVMTLAEKRNLIAHFETDPREEAFRSTYGDLAILVQRIFDSVERLHENLLNWFDRFEQTSQPA